MNFYLQLSDNLQGWLYEGEADYLWQLASSPLPGDILEVGCWVGKSTVVLGGAARLSGCVVYAIDTFMGDGTARQIQEHRRSGLRSTFHQFAHNIDIAGLRDVVIPIAQYSRIALPHLAVNLKLAFLDGTHDWENVQRDMSLCRDLMVMGGIIAVHDVCDDWPEVRDAFQEWVAGHEEYEYAGGIGRIQTCRRVA